MLAVTSNMWKFHTRPAVASKQSSLNKDIVLLVLSSSLLFHEMHSEIAGDKPDVFVYIKVCVFSWV